METSWGGRTLENIYLERCQRSSDIHLHLPRLRAEASIPAVKVLELGVRSGNSTAAFLAAADEWAGTVRSVDIVTPTVPAEFWDCGLWTFRKGSDLELADEIGSGFDIVFIDTSHHYGHTLAELHAYANKVHPDGCIILHDTELASPEDAPAGDPPYPVREAILSFIGDETDWQAEWVEGCYGLAILRRGMPVAA